MPSRSAVTWAACHRALSFAFALAASSTRASLRLRSLGAVTRTAATASRGERGPSALGGSAIGVVSDQPALAQASQHPAAAQEAGRGELGERLPQLALRGRGCLLGDDELVDVAALLCGDFAELRELELLGRSWARVPVPCGLGMAFVFGARVEQPGGA